MSTASDRKPVYRLGSADPAGFANQTVPSVNLDRDYSVPSGVETRVYWDDVQLDFAQRFSFTQSTPDAHLRAGLSHTPPVVGSLVLVPCADTTEFIRRTVLNPGVHKVDIKAYTEFGSGYHFQLKDVTVTHNSFDVSVDSIVAEWVLAFTASGVEVVLLESQKTVSKKPTRPHNKKPARKR